MGDIVEVKSGDRLPADIRIIKSAGFKVLAMLASKAALNITNSSSFDSEAHNITTWKSFRREYSLILSSVV